MTGRLADFKGRSRAECDVRREGLFPSQQHSRVWNGRDRENEPEGSFRRRRRPMPWPQSVPQATS